MPRMVWRSGTGNRCTVYTGFLRQSPTLGSNTCPVFCSLMVNHWSSENAVQQRQAQVQLCFECKHQIAQREGGQGRAPKLTGIDDHDLQPNCTSGTHLCRYNHSRSVVYQKKIESLSQKHWQSSVPAYTEGLA